MIGYIRSLNYLRHHNKLPDNYTKLYLNEIIQDHYNCNSYHYLF